MESIRLGDEGTTLRATIYDQDGVIVDLSLAIAIEFRIRKPNGTHLSKIASFLPMVLMVKCNTLLELTK